MGHPRHRRRMNTAKVRNFPLVVMRPMGAHGGAPGDSIHDRGSDADQSENLGMSRIAEVGINAGAN